ncbi:MAG: EAL domain-containing protein, partial [Nannocystaceae bacterium]|nr:EAL domain-containing protein [Nannocystaceae bacterium]
RRQRQMCIRDRSLGGVAAVLTFDDYVGASVQRGILEQNVLVPFIVLQELTSDDPVSERVRLREAGAAECLAFGELSTTVLRVAVLGSIENHRGITQMQGADASSVLDPDTGLFTTLAMRRRLAAAIERSEFESNYRYALLYIDTGAIHTSSLLTPSDVAALRTRVGLRLAHIANDFVAAPVGESGYVVLFRGFPEGEDLGAADSVRVELQRPYDHDDDELYLDLGFGLARGRGRDANAAAAIERARFEVVIPRVPTLHVQPVNEGRPPTMDVLASDLAQALKREEFSVTYQPIVDIQSQHPRGFEALIRWRHPNGEERPAADFINAANDSELIVPIGYWCVESAMRQMADWHSEFEHVSDLCISMNLSAPQVLDPLFVERVRSLLMTTGLKASAVRFEIEAGTIADHNKEARALVEGLVAAGSRVWVEDYGLSDCSVDDLRGFPLDGFKIDRRFVSRIDGTEMTSGRIRHIMTAASALGLRTLGEGIENQLQANVLRWLGCELGQGYFYEPPLSVAEVYAYLAGT